MKKFELPSFLVGIVDESEYIHWLDSKATSHFRRDKKRRIISEKRRDYKEKIHWAVMKSQGKDCYTGEELNWALLNKYRNIKQPSKPTVDHNWEQGSCEFKICSWRTNDAKNDLPYSDFIELCMKVIKFAGKHL